MIRKTFWIHRDEEEALRRAAFEERTTEAAIVRQLLREHFKIDE